MDSHLLFHIYKVLKVHSWSGVEYIKTSDNRDYTAKELMVLCFLLSCNIKCLPSVFNQYLVLFRFECDPKLETKGYKIYSKIDQRELPNLMPFLCCSIFFRLHFSHPQILTIIWCLNIKHWSVDCKDFVFRGQGRVRISCAWISLFSRLPV